MIEHQDNGLKYFSFERFGGAGVVQAIFTRRGGVSQAPYETLNLGGTVGDDPAHVLENHNRVFEVIERPFESRYDVWQVHGKHIVCTDKPRPKDQKHFQADGVFTNKPQVTLMMRFADCVPLLFFDPIRHVVGMVHAGWQGTLLKIAAEAVQVAHNAYGSMPEDFIVGIGPSICKECYRVGEGLARRFRREFGQVASTFVEQRSDGFYLDLWRANQVTLEAVSVRNIEQSDLCTAHNLGDWYSHRAENGKTGRFGVLLALDGGG